MKVKCPSCTAVGKVPSDKLPQRGANIRCPACSYVFFVGGPDGANVVADDTPETATSASGVPGPQLGGGPAVPTARFTGSRPSVPSGDHAAIDDDMPTSDYVAAQSQPQPSAAPSHATPVPPPASLPSAAAPSGDTPSSTTDQGVHVRRGNASQPSRARATGVAGRLRKSWKVKNSMGIPLDFVDTGSLREWLSGQGTHDGITASDDGGTTWLPLSEYPELADIQARGLRSRPMGSTRPSGRVSFTGMDAGEALAAAREASHAELIGPPESTATASDSHAATDASQSQSRAATDAEPPRGGKKDKKKKSKRPDAFEKEKERERQRVKILLGVLAACAFAYVGYLNLPEAQSTGPSIPNTPAGEQFRWVFEQMNGGTDDLDEPEVREHVASYIIDAVTLDEMINQLRYHDNRRPEYAIVDIVNSQPYRIEVKIRATEALDEGLVTIEVENTEPYYITVIDVRGAHM